MISIVIPAYEMHGKGVDFVRNNIDHILKQDYQDFEIIVSDNSNNNAIQDSIKGIDSRIKYFKNIQKGSSANSNFGISKSKGELIKIIFQDDFLYSNNCLSELDRNKNNANWFIYPRVQIKNYRQSKVITPSWNPYILSGYNTISAPSAIAFKKDCNVKFTESLVWYMDIDFYYRMFLNYGEPFLLKNSIIGISEWAGQVGQGITVEIYKKEKEYILNNYGII